MIQAMRRRWYAVLAILVVAAVGSALLAQDGGIYTTRTVVVFTLPGQASLLPDSGVADESVISFAASVAEVVNGGRPAPTYAAADAPSYGAGMREGVWIGLPNLGGQWATNFSRAEIEVQIVGRTAEWVRDTQAATLARIRDVADGQQSAAGADASSRVTTSVAPLTSEIVQIEPSRTAQLIAFAAMAAAGLVLAAWSAMGIDRMRRAHRPHPLPTRGVRRRGVSA